jgi:hypothetical protein
MRGNQPTVTSAEDADDGDVFVGEGSDINIHGADFLPNVLVEVNNSQIDPSFVSPIDDTLIEVENLPSATQLGIDFDTAACTAPGGVPGQRLVATPVDVSVTNLPGVCESVLTGAVVYEPDDTNCNPTPAESESAGEFDGPRGTSIRAGSCSESVLPFQTMGARPPSPTCPGPTSCAARTATCL